MEVFDWDLIRSAMIHTTLIMLVISLVIGFISYGIKGVIEQSFDSFADTKYGYWLLWIGTIGIVAAIFFLCSLAGILLICEIKILGF